MVKILKSSGFLESEEFLVFIGVIQVGFKSEKLPVEH